MNCWQVLGIDPTDNMREIKRAYAAKSKLVHPEEHPEEFRDLHDAYEMALNISKDMAAYYKYSGESDEEKTRRLLPENEHEDTTDSGRAIDEIINAEYETEQQPLAGDSGTDLFDVLESHKFKRTIRTHNATTKSSPESVENAFEDDLGFDEAIERAYQAYKNQIMLQTQRVMGKLEVLASMLPDKAKSEWSKVMQGEDFLQAMDSEYFAYHLTEFTKEHDELQKDYYKVLAKVLNFDNLSTREDKGIYTELFELCVKRGAYEYTPITKKGVLLDGFIVALMLLVSSAVRLVKHLGVVDSENVVPYVVIPVIVITLIGMAITRRDKVKVFFGKVNRRYLFSKLFFPLNPKYVYEIRLKPIWSHYLFDILLFFIATFLFVEIETFIVSFFFMLLAMFFLLAFVYMLIMHIIVGILCMKDRKKK